VGFVRADAAQRVRAIGSLEGLPPRLERALSAGGDFDPIPEPGPGDWLSVARERGQTFERFTRTASNRPAESAQHIYLRPVGDFPPRHSQLLRQLQQFGSGFFVRELRLLPPLVVEGSGIATRRNRFTDVLQLKTRDILPALARSIPPDA
jgi:hypothetical protein